MPRCRWPVPGQPIGKLQPGGMGHNRSVQLGAMPPSRAGSPDVLPCQRLDPLAGQQQTKAKVEGAQPPQPLPAIGRQRLHRRKQPDIGGALNSFRQQAVNAVGIDHQKRPPSPQFGHCAVDMDGEPLALPVGQERRVLGVHPTIV